jgi:hypothetical protein
MAHPITCASVKYDERYERAVAHLMATYNMTAVEAGVMEKLEQEKRVTITKPRKTRPVDMSSGKPLLILQGLHMIGMQVLWEAVDSGADDDEVITRVFEGAEEWLSSITSTYTLVLSSFFPKKDFTDLLAQYDKAFRCAKGRSAKGRSLTSYFAAMYTEEDMAIVEVKSADPEYAFPPMSSIDLDVLIEPKYFGRTVILGTDTRSVVLCPDRFLLVPLRRTDQDLGIYDIIRAMQTVIESLDPSDTAESHRSSTPPPMHGGSTLEVHNPSFRGEAVSPVTKLGGRKWFAGFGHKRRGTGSAPAVVTNNAPRHALSDLRCAIECPVPDTFDVTNGVVLVPNMLLPDEQDC